MILEQRPAGLFLFFLSFTLLKPQNTENRILSKIIIEGNNKTKDYILFREIHHPLHELIDSVQIEKDRNRLDNLGIFSDVRWQLLPIEDGSIVLKYIVQESIQKTPPAVFPTYNESKGWSLNALWLFNNFRGRNQILALSGSIGGESTYGLSFKDPWILNDHISFSLDLKKNFYINRFLNSDVELNSFRIGLGRWFKHKIKTETSFLLESKIFNLESDIIRFKYFSTYLNIRYDKRDIFWNPGEGVLLSSSLEYRKGYDFHIFQTLIFNQSLSLYIKLKNIQRKGVVALNGVLEKKLGYKSKFFQDYIGGSNTIRGWIVPDSEIYNSEPFRFGHDYFHTSIEYRYEIIPKYVTASGIESGLGIVFFSDNGFIIRNRASEAILSGYGFGIRVPFPIVGVLRFDYAMGLNSYKVKSNSLHFGIGQKF